MQNNTLRRRVIPVTKWNDYHDYPKLSTLRYLIFHAEENGFCKAIRRIGNRILIDENAFYEWLDETNGHGKAQEATNAK